MYIKPQKLLQGDTIGIIAPAMALAPEYFKLAADCLVLNGFTVKQSKNLFKTTYGYAATPEERADDFNNMILNDTIKMILFGGGEVSNEILPYIDFQAIKKHPKIICSYSDSTTILNAVTGSSGVVTYYGQSPRTFFDLNEYNNNSFKSSFMNTEIPTYIKSGNWKTIHNGICKGKLIGGYLGNFAFMLNGKYLNIDKNEKYILFIEDHEKFSSPPVISKYLSHIEQSGLFDQVGGILFGHYSDDQNPVIDNILGRLGDKYKIPLVRCDDFGHGIYNNIIPIGVSATLDANRQSIVYDEAFLNA